MIHFRLSSAGYQQVGLLGDMPKKSKKFPQVLGTVVQIDRVAIRLAPFVCLKIYKKEDESTSNVASV